MRFSRKLCGSVNRKILLRVWAYENDDDYDDDEGKTANGMFDEPIDSSACFQRIFKAILCLIDFW